MAKNHASDDLDFVGDDDFLISLLPDKEEVKETANTVFSDAIYAEKLQFQEALMCSVITSQIKKDEASSSLPIIVQITPECMEMEMITTEESGQSSLSFCEICVEKKESNQMFKIQSCVHSFCSDCISKHVATKIGDRAKMVMCPAPNCTEMLDLDSCRPVLPKAVIDLWEEALCEEVINESQRFYCPFKDCSAMLVVDDNEGESIKEAECPFCHRLFCAQCYVPWHANVVCEEFQSLNEDEKGREEIMVLQLARDKKWSRCPQCKFYVERTEGCPHMTCRCKFQFCYGCGAEWTQSHGGCHRD